MMTHDEIVRRHGTALLQLARLLTGNEGDAYDLVQDTFERSLRKLPMGMPATRISAWLQVTLRNRYYDLHRCSARRIRAPKGDPSRIVVASHESEEEPRWTQVEPAQLWHCVERLNPALREVLLLRERDRRSHAEIASVLNIPVSTVGTRCYRALRHLRKMLEHVAPSQVGAT